MTTEAFTAGAVFIFLLGAAFFLIGVTWARSRLQDLLWSGKILLLEKDGRQLEPRRDRGRTISWRVKKDEPPDGIVIVDVVPGFTPLITARLIREESGKAQDLIFISRRVKDDIICQWPKLQGEFYKVLITVEMMTDLKTERPEIRELVVYGMDFDLADKDQWQ